MSNKELKSITQEEAEAKTRIKKADKAIAQAKTEQKSNPSPKKKKPIARNFKK